MDNELYICQFVVSHINYCDSVTFIANAFFLYLYRCAIVVLVGLDAQITRRLEDAWLCCLGVLHFVLFCVSLPRFVEVLFIAELCCELWGC